MKVPVEHSQAVLATDAVWVFGYGSLVWRPAFDYVDRRPGYIKGYARRFWQASPDHRGTPEAPGRVATLIPLTGAVTWGVAYALDPTQTEDILAALDYREKAGYERLQVAVYDRQDRPQIPQSLVYMASEGNPNFTGPQDEAIIAEAARHRHGPSGSNAEYILKLDEALRGMGVDDPHVRRLAELVRKMGHNGP